MSPPEDGAGGRSGDPILDQIMSEIKEVGREVHEMRGKVDDIEETLEGDERRGFTGLVSRMEMIEDRQNRYADRVAALQEAEKIKKAREDQSKRFFSIALVILGAIATVLSIIVGVMGIAG